MSNYISREAAKMAVVKAVGKGHSPFNAIVMLPAADVREVKRAEWKMRGGRWRCTACDAKALLSIVDDTGGWKEYGHYKSNFCPNCGADMRLTAEELTQGHLHLGYVDGEEQT